MQNSLFRRRLAVRACFDVLLERQLVPSSSSPTTTTNDITTTLLTHRMFVQIFIDSLYKNRSLDLDQLLLCW